MKLLISRPPVGASFATEPTLVSYFYFFYPGQRAHIRPRLHTPPQSNDLSGYASGLVAWRILIISPVLLALAAGRAGQVTDQLLLCTGESMRRSTTDTSSSPWYRR
jgi:hypothetical protein